MLTISFFICNLRWAFLRKLLEFRSVGGADNIFAAFGSWIESRKTNETLLFLHGRCKSSKWNDFCHFQFSFYYAYINHTEQHIMITLSVAFKDLIQFVNGIKMTKVVQWKYLLYWVFSLWCRRNITLYTVFPGPSLMMSNGES